MYSRRGARNLRVCLSNGYMDLAKPPRPLHVHPHPRRDHSPPRRRAGGKAPPPALQRRRRQRLEPKCLLLLTALPHPGGQGLGHSLKQVRSQQSRTVTGSSSSSGSAPPPCRFFLSFVRAMEESWCSPPGFDAQPVLGCLVGLHPSCCEVV